MDHQAFAQLLGNYGEFIGSIAVVATLIYLARQVSSGSKIAKSSTHIELQNFYAATNDLIVATPDVADLMVRLRNEDTDFTPKEQVLINHLMMRWVNVWNAVQIAYDQNQIDEQTFGVWKRDVVGITSTYPGLKSRFRGFLDFYPDWKKDEIWSPIVGEPAND